MKGWELCGVCWLAGMPHPHQGTHDQEWRHGSSRIPGESTAVTLLHTINVS